MEAGRVILIDHLEYRLEKARTFAHAEACNFTECHDIVVHMKKITEHPGADVAIDALGPEADGNLLQHLTGDTFKLQGGSPVALNWAIDSVRKGGTVSVMGAYGPIFTGDPLGFPERQPEKWARERSVEHKFLTPVFGTSCPPKGASGVMRKYAYARFSEGRAAHWMILVVADRVDAIESHLRSFVTARPDNPVIQTGVLSEFSHHGLSSRVGKKRADLVHQPLDLLVVAGPRVGAGAAAYAGLRRFRAAHSTGRLRSAPKAPPSPTEWEA